MGLPGLYTIKVYLDSFTPFATEAASVAALDELIASSPSSGGLFLRRALVGGNPLGRLVLSESCFVLNPSIFFLVC